MPPREQPIHPKYVIAGNFTRDFIVTASHQPCLDIMGGSAPFAAAGCSLWDGPVGILARVGEDYPADWLASLAEWRMDVHGVKILPHSLEGRRFYGYSQEDTFQTNSPARFFAEMDYPLPVALMNYNPPAVDAADDLHSRRQSSPMIGDAPPDYHDAIAAHLCQLDFISHSVLQTMLRTGQIKTITLEVDPGYLLPEHWNSMRNVLAGLSCASVDESAARAFFRGRTNDLREITTGLAAFGCEHVVIHQQDGQKLLHQRSTGRFWQAPAYPAPRINLHSSRHAFGGGFLAGYLLTYDPARALAYGVVSELMAGDSLRPGELFSGLPGLAEARLKVLFEKIIPI
jgi:ribokinase